MFRLFDLLKTGTTYSAKKFPFQRRKCKIVRGQVLSFQDILGPMCDYATIENLSTHQDML